MRRRRRPPHGGKKVSRHGGNRYWKNTPVAWEFYDLTIHRHEMRNRYGDPEYREVIADLKRELRAMRERLGETDARYPRLEEIIAAHWNE